MDDIKLFVKNEEELETLKQTVRIYIYIGMEFVIEKCAMLIMKSGKRQMTVGTKLPSQEKITTVGENQTYKYLGILEALFKVPKFKIQRGSEHKAQELGNIGSGHHQISGGERKNKKEYLRRTRKQLKTKLCFSSKRKTPELYLP